jgi:creatinine amidohydrolase
LIRDQDNLSSTVMAITNKPVSRFPTRVGSTRLADLAWPAYHAAASADPIIIIPVGAIEQHGPHLPISTDAVIAQSLAAHLADQLDALMAETLTYGMRSDRWSGGGEGYPGTLSLRPETMVSLVVDILDGLAEDGFSRFFFLNAHYENAPLLREAARRITRRHPATRVLFSNWWDLLPKAELLTLFPDGFPGMELEHAGLLETSLMLHVAPALVQTDQVFPRTTIVPPGYETYPENSDPPIFSGALAPATDATAQIGERLLGLLLRGAAEAARDVFGER